MNFTPLYIITETARLNGMLHVLYNIERLKYKYPKAYKDETQGVITHIREQCQNTQDDLRKMIDEHNKRQKNLPL